MHFDLIKSAVYITIVHIIYFADNHVITMRILIIYSAAIFTFSQIISCSSQSVVARSLIDNSGVKTYLAGVGYQDFQKKDLLSVTESFALNSLHAECAQRGWVEAAKRSDDNAIIIIRLIDPQTVSSNYSISIPTYGTVGGGASTFQSTTMIPGSSPITTTGSIYTNPTYQQIGSQNISGTRYFYRHCACINGVKMNGQMLFEVISTVIKESPITDKDKKKAFDRALKAMATNQDTR
jgi:hypothetical protein